MMANDAVFELPVPVDFDAWQAIYRPQIRCLVWWEELERSPPRVGRAYFFGDQGERSRLRLFYPDFCDAGEWRTPRKNRPKEAKYWRFTKPRIIKAPGFFVSGKGVGLLDRVHRIKRLKPIVIIVDYIVMRATHMHSIANTLGAWWRS